MKICFYIANMSGGGAERVFLNLINYTASVGNEVTLVLNQKQGAYLGLITEDIEIIEIGVSRPFKSALKLKRLFKEHDDFMLHFQLFEELPICWTTKWGVLQYAGERFRLKKISPEHISGRQSTQSMDGVSHE
jgi:hypothetical protein